MGLFSKNCSRPGQSKNSELFICITQSLHTNKLQCIRKLGKRGELKD